MISNKPTVLVVDDERVVREGCRRILEAEGFEALTAEDGETAMAVLDDRPVDLVLADLKMPGIGGLELLAWVRQRRPGVPVIVITGHGGKDARAQCEKAGAMGLVNKPFQSSEMVKAVRAAL